jgi:hypothetical protein
MAANHQSTITNNQIISNDQNVASSVTEPADRSYFFFLHKPFFMNPDLLNSLWHCIQSAGECAEKNL